jgi:acyl-CoA synthetase (AMP-forming)/AMP-acid ligase II
MRRNPDGTLDFVDRRKYLIKSGGENIYPAEIERVLIALPGVADVVVVRKPDPKWGEVPVAFVVRSAEGTLTAEQAIAACRSPSTLSATPGGKPQPLSTTLNAAQPVPHRSAVRNDSH